MKTENKRLIALLCAVLILVGCGAKEAQAVHVQAADFFASFTEILEPIADQFEINQTAQIDHENGEIEETWTLTDTLIDKDYSLEVVYAADGPVKSVILSTDKGARTDTTFAVLSYYVYKAAGFKDLKADAFYEKFGLLTAEPETPDYFVELAPNAGAGASTLLDSIDFIMMFVDENAPE